MMTVYNCEDYVAEAIQSVLDQSLRDFDFVIVDDGSDDSTVRILQDSARRDSRINLILSRRVGRPRALNLAWRATTGTYIANLDADDLALPDRLERQRAFLDAHPEVGLLGTGVRVVNDLNGTDGVRHPPLGDADLRSLLVRRNPISNSTVMINRQTLEALGGYKDSLRSAVDYDLMVRIAARSELACLPEVLTVRRVTGAAYFTNQVPKAGHHFRQIHIRWEAWRFASRKPRDLWFVAFEPLVRAAYEKTREVVAKRLARYR